MNCLFQLSAEKTKFIRIYTTLYTGGGIIGKDCEISEDVFFGSEPYLIRIGNKVRITRNVEFITHDGGLWVLRNLYSDMKNADYFGKIVIEDNVNIGWNVIIMPGVTIGKNSIVGAGAVVTKSIPENSVVAGIPARIIETTEQYYQKKKDKTLSTNNLSRDEKREYLKKIYDSL